MKKPVIKIIPYILLALSPLLYYQFRKYLPTYGRRPLVYEILFLIPFILYFITAFLGLKLNQSRIFFTSILWAVIYYLLSISKIYSYDFKEYEIQLVQLLALSFFWILSLIFVHKEKYILGLYGLLRSVYVALPLVGTQILASKIFPDVYPNITGHPLFTFDWWYLPDWVLFLMIGAVTFLIFQKDKSIQYFKNAIFTNLIPLLFSFNFTIGRGQFDIESGIFNMFSFSVMGCVFLYALYRMYWEKVYIDELTGIPNRRAFDEYLKKLGRKYTIAMIDVDHFKKFNDTYGHTEGDNVLRFVASHIADGAGTNVFRYGGEEFSAIYKGMHTKQAFSILDQMRENLASSTFYLRSSEDVRKLKSKKNRRASRTIAKSVKVTISVGIAQKSRSKKEAEDVIIKADKALYRAKEKGRNRCEKTLA